MSFKQEGVVGSRNISKTTGSQLRKEKILKNPEVGRRKDFFSPLFPCFTFSDYYRNT